MVIASIQEPRLSWLRALVVFGEHVNMTRAAEQLGISQPALHAQLKGLEQALGSPLYVRRGRGLALTDAGKDALVSARDIVSAVERLRTGLTRTQGPQDHAPLILAAGEGAFLYLLGPALERFRRTHPTTPLRLLPSPGASAAAAVLEGRADLAVTAQPPPPAAALMSRTFARVPAVLAMPSEHPLAQQSGDVAMSALGGQRWIVPAAGSPLRSRIEVASSAAGVTAVDVVAEVTGWPLILEFVRLGLGIAAVNAFCRAPDGVTFRPLPELGESHYRVLWRRRSVGAHPAEAALRDDLRLREISERR